MSPDSRQVRRAKARENQKRAAARAPSARRIPRKAWYATAGVAVLLLVVGALIVALGSAGAGEKVSLAGSGDPNGNLFNTRDESGPIQALNVAQLKVAWKLPITTRSEYGSYSSSPIIAGGVIYSQDLSSNVQAIDLGSGKVLWSKDYESPDQGPNGLVVAAGRVYGATATSAFALDEKTGAQIWSVTLTRNAHEGIDMAPGYHDGIVYVSTVPGNNQLFYGGEGDGILWALDGASGRKLWSFNTAPTSRWSPAHTSINSGGGLWYTPAFDEHGYMYIGTGNPAPFPGSEQFPWGSSRPGPDLYTDSLVKLNASTGKLVWYYQLTPHDLYDHDLQDPPILVNVGARQVVLAAGKAGIVIAIDAQTGRLIWQRAVGKHDGHDNDGLYAMRHEYRKLKTPETVFPGLLGGVIAPMASDGSTVFVPVVNLPVKYTSQTHSSEGGEGTGGELVALDVKTGAVKWTHQFQAPVFGAASVVNDVVLTTSSNGTLYGFDANEGSVLWEAQLPAASNTGVAVSGDTVVVPAGLAEAAGQTPELIAYRLPSSKSGSETG